MILVTDAKGFVGKQGVARLQLCGDSLRILIQESDKEPLSQFRETEIIIGDLLDESILSQAVSGVDTVIHLAGKTVDSDGTGFHRMNVEGMESLCRVAADARVKKFIYLSTVGVYGHRRFRDADESTDVRPDTDFTRSKAEAENIILDHHRAGDFQGIILRQRYVYGDGDVGVIARMFRSMARHPILIGGGRARISLILADELAEIIARFATEEIPHDDFPVYHVTDGAPISYKEILKILSESYGLTQTPRSMPFYSLFFSVWLREKLFRIDPEKSKSSLSSMRLKLLGLDQSFSNRKLLDLFPDLRFTSFEEAFSSVRDYYQRIVE